MSYFLTAEPRRQLRSQADKPCRIDGDPPSENRVVGLDAFTYSCTWSICSESPEPHREIITTDTTTVSGITYWLSRDPIEEAGGVNLYRFVNNDPANKVDFLGLALVDVLRQQVLLIETAMQAGMNDIAADNARLLYRRLAWGGEWKQPFASEMMQHWLNKGGPKTLSKRRVKKLVRDEEVSKQFLSFLGVAGSGSGCVTKKCTQVTPKLNTDNYYALGTFTLCFTGCYCPKKGCTEMKGTWEMSDKYDWHKGLDVTVFGIVIKDDYAVLVENAGHAQSYDVDGTWKGKVKVCGSGGGGGR